jgi:hypothetical protein
MSLDRWSAAASVTKGAFAGLSGTFASVVDYLPLFGQKMLEPLGLRRRSAVLALLLGGLSGCQGTTAPAACDGTLDVLVTPGVTPTFSWSPSCGISALVVTDESSVGAPAVWAFTVSEFAPLGPGVRYGRLPHGATELNAAQSLRAGASYHVYVWYTVGGDMIAAQGTRSFAP